MAKAIQGNVSASQETGWDTKCFAITNEKGNSLGRYDFIAAATSHHDCINNIDKTDCIIPRGGDFVRSLDGE